MTEIVNDVPAWDFWDEAGIHCGGYNSGIDMDMLNVLKLIAAEEYAFCDDIVAKLGLSVNHVELIQYIFCSMDWCDYGTSPRGCFMYPDKKHLVTKLEEFIEKVWSKDE